jgi:site-specific recombinase XerD
MLTEIETFVNWLRRRNPAARTWRDYRGDLTQFAALTGDRPPGAITFHDVDRFVAQQAALGLQPSTVNRRLAAITAFYSFLADEDPDLVCPVLSHRHDLKERQRLPRPVQEEDLGRFFVAIDNNRDLAMFLLMLRCGLRISEVAHLQLADLYLNEPNPRLVAHGKGSKDRSVYLSPQAERALRTWLAERPPTPSDFVFLSYLGDGMSTTAIHKRLMRYRQQAGVQLTAHRLRHSFANDLLSADVPNTSIQKLLGHRWLETTQIYIAANDRQACTWRCGPGVQADYYAASQKLEGWQ